MTAPAVTAPPQVGLSPAVTAAAVVALVEAQASTRELLTGQLMALVHAAVSGFTGWYDHSRITDWSAKLAHDVEPILRLLARSTDAFQARVLSELVGKRVPTVGSINVTDLRDGVTHAGAYARAADVYRWQQSQLDTAARTVAAAPDPAVPELQDPLEAAVERALAVADMDSQLVVQQQSRKAYTEAHDRRLITGWRRVVHPELSKGGTCGLCLAASDQMYGPREPMPLHANCNCVPLPVYDHNDPGSTLNSDDLTRLYREAGSTNRRHLKRTRYQVNEHGELGPLLNPHGAKVRTARQAKSATGDVKSAKTAEQKAADLQRVRDSLTPALDKARVLAGQNPKKWGTYLTKLEARISDLDHQLAA